MEPGSLTRLATVQITLIALLIGALARRSASPGSLYSYATDSLPPVCASIAAWALLLGYVATGSSIAAGFALYADVLLKAFDRPRGAPCPAGPVSGDRSRGHGIPRRKALRASDALARRRIGGVHRGGAAAGFMEERTSPRLASIAAERQFHLRYPPGTGAGHFQLRWF